MYHILTFHCYSNYHCSEGSNQGSLMLDLVLFLFLLCCGCTPSRSLLHPPCILPASHLHLPYIPLACCLHPICIPPASHHHCSCTPPACCPMLCRAVAQSSTTERPVGQAPPWPAAGSPCPRGSVLTHRPAHPFPQFWSSNSRFRYPELSVHLKPWT